ncbi:MAG: class I SAM-dependent methyltransferase [Angustibacter sp.]
MAIFESLVEAYAAEGLNTAAGLNPTLTDDFFAAPFAWLTKDGASVTDGVGISPAELYLVECLAQARPARRIFVLGNAFGWSTLALALANPESEVVAIDAGFDENTLLGLETTNRIAQRLELNVLALKAVSPQDVPAVLEQHLPTVDLAFIDGFHSPTQVVKDWRAVQPFLAADSLVLFHDIVFCELQSGFQKIVEESGWQGSILPATTTGMALLARETDPALDRLIAAWGGHPESLAVIHAAAAAQAHQTGAEQRAEALAYIRSIESGIS